MSLELLLDAQIVIELHHASALDLLQGRSVPLVCVEEVWDEITDSPNHVAQGRAIREALDGHVRVDPIMLDSPEAATLAALRPSPAAATKDLGEAASIALASHRAGMVFATNDRNAAFGAIRELRGRTIELHGLMRMLAEDGAVLERIVRGQAAIAHRRKANRLWSTPPEWWSSWLARCQS